jgi:DNA (cytosine-5)-methyltransferase 1
MHFVPLLACDVDATALEVYSENFRTEPFPALDLNGLSSLVNGASTPFELSLSERIRSDIDFLVAGPPCQGHSNLNNYTRRNDPKNGLYIKVARFARLFEPKCILIENVPTVTRDKSNVVPRTMNELAELGYSVQIGVLDLSRIGVPQTRKRHVLIAAKGVHSSRVPTVRRLMSAFAASPRTVRWALRDLLSVRTKDLYDVAPAMSQETRRRIDHLFDNNLFELPDEERPDCHRTKDHSYGSVYGRMRWDSPAPTITRGFSTMGQGRFVHPRRRRTITPHEAARLQLIPDFFSFGAARTRKALGALIGNAVPPKLSYVVALELLR